MVLLILILVVASLDWLYLVARTADFAAQPNGGLAAAMLSNQANSIAIVIAVCVAGLAIGWRLDKLLKATTAVRDALTATADRIVKVTTMTEAPQPQMEIQTTELPARTEINHPKSIIIDINNLPIRLVMRAARGRLTEFETLLDAIQGAWYGNSFATLAISCREPVSNRPTMIAIADIRRVGVDQKSLSADVQGFFERLAQGQRGQT